MKLIIEERTKRITLICCMVLIVGTIGGTILGYPPMKQSLLEQGVYHEQCPDPSDPTPCSEQLLKLDLMFTLGVSVMNGVALPTGVCVDYFGPKKVGIVGSLAYLLGTLLFAFSNSINFDAYLPAFLLFAFGGNTLFMIALKLSNAIPEKSSVIISIFAGAFNFSTIIFLLMRVAYQSLSVRYEGTFFVYSAAPLFALIVSIFLIPSVSYVTPHPSADFEMKEKSMLDSVNEKVDREMELERLEKEKKEKEEKEENEQKEMKEDKEEPKENEEKETKEQVEKKKEEDKESTEKEEKQKEERNEEESNKKEDEIENNEIEGNKKVEIQDNNDEKNENENENEKKQEPNGEIKDETGGNYPLTGVEMMMMKTMPPKLVSKNDPTSMPPRLASLGRPVSFAASLKEFGTSLSILDKETKRTFHDWKFKDQFVTWAFWTGVTFISVVMLRLNFFIGTVQGFLQSLAAPGQEDQISTMLFMYSLAFPLGGVCFVPVVAYLVSQIKLHYLYLIIWTIALIFNTLTLIQNLNVQYASLLLFTFLNPLFYTARPAYCSQIFGFKNFGKVFGAVTFFSAIFNLFSYLLSYVTLNIADSNYFPANMALTVCCILSISFPIYLLFRE